MTHTQKNRGRLALLLGATTAGFAIDLAACSGGGSGSGGTTSTTGTTSSSGGSGSSGNNVDAGGNVSSMSGSCSNPTVPIVFAPMYSAYIPGSTAQTFAIPAVTADGNTATWSLSDPTQANLQVQGFMDNGTTIPGVLITVTGTGNDAGQVTVVATESDGSCGASVLTITTNAESDWTIGNARYNDGVALHFGSAGGGGIRDGGFGGFGGFDGNFAGFDGSFMRVDASAFTAGGGGPNADAGSYFETDGGTACTNCHGPTATNGPYKTVSHTPEQTGGFSDMDLQNIIWNGEVPDGGYFDPTVIDSTCDGGAQCTAAAMATWHGFHRWADITADELPGVICYLRSLAPLPQNGASNFGGLRGGGGRRDGGGGPPPNQTPSPEAAAPAEDASP
jgi:hypothetical protein